MHEREKDSHTREALRLFNNPERERYLQFCREDESRADAGLQHELDLLLEEWGYATPERVPSENVGISVEKIRSPSDRHAFSLSRENLYFIRVVWHWPAGRIVHEYLFTQRHAARDAHKETNWIYDDGEDSLPERTVGSHSLPYVSGGELDYLKDLLERSYEGYIACSKSAGLPSPHPNRFARSING